MNGKQIISPRQWFFISLFSTICLTPFGMPTMLYRVVGRGAWVPIVAAYLLTIWGEYAAFRICAKYPGMNIVQWSSQIMGRWIGGFYSIGVIIVFYLWGVIMLFEFLELIIYTQLPYTSRLLLLVFTVGPVVYLLSRGLEVWVRWGELFGILLIVTLLFINGSQLVDAAFGYLLPLSDAFREPMNFFKPEALAALFIFRGAFSIYFLHPHIPADRQLFRWSMLSLAIAFIAVLAAVVLPIAKFGLPFAGKLAFPYQESLGTVMFTWFPIRGITMLTPIVWQMIIVYVLAVSLFSASSGIRTMLKVGGERWILCVLGAITVGLTLIPIQHQTLAKLLIYWSLAGIGLLIVIPSLLLSILEVRRWLTE
jgi:spore germination protein KB